MVFVKSIADVFFGLFVIIIVLWTAVEIPTYNMSFYKSQFEKNNTYETIGISEQDLEKVTRIVIDYLKRRTDELNTAVVINGESVLFYNQREIDHMVDVQNLFKLFAGLRIVGLIYCGIYIAKRHPLRHVFDVLRNTFIIFFCASVTLFILISRDFDYWFDRFHLVFFSNDLWQLDPTRDNLINMVPLNFFISIAALIGVIFIVASVGIIIISIAVPRIFKLKYASDC